MTKILVLDDNILAIDPVDAGDVWTAESQIIPKHVAKGAKIVGAELPDDFRPAFYRWNGSEVVPRPEAPPPVAPTEPGAWAQLVKKYDAVVQARLDNVAAGFGYGDPNRPGVSPILHAISYADEPAVPHFQAEGQLLRAWRSRYWKACWPILEAVRLQQRPVPSPEALIVELDAQAPAPTPADVDAKIAELSA